MKELFLKARAMTADATGKWVTDYFLRVNVNQVQMFRVIDTISTDEFVMEVQLQGKISPMILAIHSGDIAPWVKN